MIVYAFWNNKGGTGKTSLAFQTICHYAEKNANKRVLAIDLCPQANLSELLLGGLLGAGSQNLANQYVNTRRSIAGYFQARLPSPYIMPQIDPCDFVMQPTTMNGNIPTNIDLVPGDGLVELQSNATATLANTQIPGTNTWMCVIYWVRDFLRTAGDEYDTVFIDLNPSFSVYTQIALAAADRMILPVMADDSSRRAVENAFSLVHGISLPSPMYEPYSFAKRLRDGEQTPPRIHLFVKNRLTQYMGPASAYYTVLTSIDALIERELNAHPHIFTFSDLADGTAEVRDFQTTGVVAFAEGVPFSKLRSGTHSILGRKVQINPEYVALCRDEIDKIVERL